MGWIKWDGSRFPKKSSISHGVFQKKSTISHGFPKCPKYIVQNIVFCFFFSRVFTWRSDDLGQHISLSCASTPVFLAFDWAYELIKNPKGGGFQFVEDPHGIMETIMEHPMDENWGWKPGGSALAHASAFPGVCGGHEIPTWRTCANMFGPEDLTSSIKNINIWVFVSFTTDAVAHCLVCFLVEIWCFWLMIPRKLLSLKDGVRLSCQVICPVAKVDVRGWKAWEPSRMAACHAVCDPRWALENDIVHLYIYIYDCIHVKGLY